MDLEWSCRAHQGQTVCSVAGEIDLYTASDLERAGRKAMDAHGPCVSVDFSGVTFLDASGITALIGLHRAAVDRGGYLRLDRVPARILRILTLTGTAELLGAGRPALIDLSQVDAPSHAL
jgi:anti-sigma B factor antagonist